MLLFNVAINPVLNKCDQINYTDFNILGYADDLAIINYNFHELQHIINRINALIQWMNMKLNPKKCATLSLLNASKKSSKQIKIDGTPIKNISKTDKESYKYLGIDRKHTIPHNPHDVYAKFTNRLNAIHRSALLPWHKINNNIIT